MFVIGLVGGSGSGKGVIGDIFRESGYLIYDTDAVYHEMISRRSACTTALSDAFGEKILHEDGSLNRRALADIVFAATPAAGEALKLLNRIAHSHVRDAFDSFLTYHPDDKIVLDAPLLFEAGMENTCQLLLAVTAPRDVRIARIMKRDHITEQEATRRIDHQMGEADLISRCDYVLQNDGTLDALKEKTTHLIKILNERIDNHE